MSGSRLDNALDRCVAGAATGVGYRIRTRGWSLRRAVTGDSEVVAA